VYYADEADRPVILASIDALQSQCGQPVAVQVLPLENYFTAEEYHQDYLDKNPGGYCHIGSGVFERLRHALKR
jgi:peptide methionine sulfoxide reductase MsrA